MTQSDAPNELNFDPLLMNRLLKYSLKYEISFQMWPNQYTIYIAKDGIDLYSYGGGSGPNETMIGALNYLDRINKKS